MLECITKSPSSTALRCILAATIGGVVLVCTLVYISLPAAHEAAFASISNDLPADTKREDIATQPLESHQAAATLVAKFTNVQWTEPANVTHATALNTAAWDLKEMHAEYNQQPVDNLDYVACQLLQRLADCKFGFVGDSLTRNTFERGFLADLQRENQRYPCKQGGYIERIHTDCQHAYYESTQKDNFVAYRKQEPHEKCLLRYHQNYQECGGANKKFAGRPRFADMNLSTHHCNCHPRTDCVIQYEYKGETRSFSMDHLEGYRIYPAADKYAVDGHIEPFVASIGPQLFRDFVRDMDITVVNIGQHYSSPAQYIQVLTFIADTVKEDMERDRRKRHIWRLTYPQHFRNSKHENINYGLHEYRERNDLDDEQVNDIPWCLRYGQVAQRHWTDILAFEVFCAYNISMLDYYEVMKIRGDAHARGKKHDCTHIEGSKTHNIWRPFWFLLNELLDSNK